MTEASYRALVESIDEVIFVLDARGRLAYISPAIERKGPYRVEELLGKPMERLVHGEDLPALKAGLERALVGEMEPCRFRLLDKDVHMRATARPLREGGKVIGLAGVMTDITQQVRTEEELQRSEARYRAIVEDQTELICRFLPDGTLTFVNRAYGQYLGKKPEELVGQNFMAFASLREQRRFPRYLASFGPHKPVAVAERRMMGPRGEVRWLQWTDRAIFDPQGRLVEFQSVGRDITERKEEERFFRHLAYHDPLTGLPNRALFHDRLAQALARAQRSPRQLALMLLDLDHFKRVNDTLGHQVGDELLQGVAGRLTGALRKSDSVARMGGDEFMILLPEIARPQDALTVAQKLLGIIRQPFTIGEKELRVTASLGVVVYPLDGEDAQGLVRMADQAMYRAKEEGRDRYCGASPRQGGVDDKKGFREVTV